MSLMSGRSAPPAGGMKKQCNRCRNDCGKDFMTCNLCESFFHIKCEGLTTQQLHLYREMDKAKAPYQWLCSSCRKLDLMSIVKSVQAMQSRLEKLEEQVSQMKHMPPPQVGACASSDGPQPEVKNVLSEAVSEMLDIDRRKLNLVITGMPSGDDKTDAERIQELMEDPALEVTDDLNITDFQRIGNNGHLLIHFDTLESKRAILKNAHKLRGSVIALHQRVFISPDLTRKQRQEEYNLRVELRARKQNGEVGLKISRGRIVQKTQETAASTTATPQPANKTPSPYVIRIVRPGQCSGGASSSVIVGAPRTPVSGVPMMVPGAHVKN